MKNLFKSPLLSDEEYNAEVFRKRDIMLFKLKAEAARRGGLNSRPPAEPGANPPALNEDEPTGEE